MSNIFPPGAELAGHYRILGLSASVGIGSVFEAERLVGQGRVAFKWLRFPNTIRQFSLDELVLRAQAARSFSHPGAAATYDVVREGSSVFVVSELVRGEPLLTRLAPHLLRPAERIDVLLQALRAVAAAHDQRVVHGGVHPGNLFLEQGQDGEPPTAKVLDFVTSHFAALGLGASNLPLERAVYRDREQLCGDAELDARADVFAFGVLIYQALTGRLPYYGENAIDLAGRLLTSVLRPVAAFRAEASGPLDRAVSAALTVSRAQRPSSLHALIEALVSFSACMGPSGAPARTKAGTALMVVQRSEASVGSARSLRTLTVAGVASEPHAPATTSAPMLASAPAPTRAAKPSPARPKRWLRGLAIASSLTAVATLALYLSTLSLRYTSSPPKLHAAGVHARVQDEVHAPPREAPPTNDCVERESIALPKEEAPPPAPHAADPVETHVEQPSPASAPAPAPRMQPRSGHPLEHSHGKARKLASAGESPFRAGLPPEIGEF